MSGNKVLVGMSGGVDSSVSAYILQDQGYEVHGLFMKNWEDDDGSPYCSIKEDFMDAVFVADQLNIPLYEINFAKEYKERVNKALKLMEKSNLEMLLITSPQNFRYFTGLDSYFWESPSRPWFILLTQKNDPIAVVPSIGENALKKTWSNDNFIISVRSGQNDLSQKNF